MNIFDEGELSREATIRKFRIVRPEGAREVAREVEHYNLPAILAVGYRVRSRRGTQFRQWATARLNEYLVKGFTLDDERLKNPPGKGQADYFDELLERIRDIRASERRVYLRVREILALAADTGVSTPYTSLVRPLTLLAFLMCWTLPAGVRAAGLEETLNVRWRGGWVVVRPSLASSCDGYYNDNFMAGDRAESSARRRFDPGELARVERIAAKRGRVDVFLDFAEDVLEERHDGPFTLYEPKECRVQLQVPVPARVEADAVEARLAELLDLRSSRQEAEASPDWNRRRREPFPENYEQTLAAYESWKAAQVNAAVMARLDGAIEEAAHLNDRLRSEPEYLEGFAKGVDRGQDRVQGDCPSLIRATFSPDSGDRGKSSDWRRGYEDGQRLAWNLELMRRLKACFVPVPGPPP